MHVKPGLHINAIGAITPEREEFTQDVFEHCTLVAADNPDAVRKLSKEFVQHYGDRVAAWSQVKPISQLVGEGKQNRQQDDVTLFKAMGMGISDLALGTELLNRAREAGRGRPLPQPKRATLRLSA